MYINCNIFFIYIKYFNLLIFLLINLFIYNLICFIIIMYNIMKLFMLLINNNDWYIYFINDFYMFFCYVCSY